jgi:precorrin-2 dehydrogenase/sirohydrochlorin ferrochelatase
VVEGYPVVLCLRGRQCLLVGGGEVARRKVERLLAAGATVAVIAPSLSPALQILWQRGEITWEKRSYREGDLEGFFLVFAASSDPVVNQKVGEEAHQRGILCNVVDCPAASSFLTPAVVEWEGLTVALSSGGKSPYLVGLLRRWLESHLPKGLGELLQILERKRRELQGSEISLEEKKMLYRELIDHWKCFEEGGKP